jgi:hypothetical protein
MLLDASEGVQGILVDADNKWIPYPIRADTETGVVEHYASDQDNKLLMDDDGAVVTVLTYKPPLRLLPIINQNWKPRLLNPAERAVPCESSTLPDTKDTTTTTKALLHLH